MLGTEPAIVETYVKSGDIVLIFAPVLNHQDRSYQTHQAAECAADQGYFWEFHHSLFENQDQMWGGDIPTVVKQLAANAGLNTDDFNACIDTQRNYDRVLAQDEVRQEAGIRGQPVFFINDEVLIGPQPFDIFQEVIESQLTQ